MTAIIELDHLSFSYHNTPILTDISFKIQPGEFIGIIGPNGGGKTTLLRLIMGFLKPTKGRIKVFDKAPGSYANTNGRLAYVPQSVRLDREFPISVLEVVLSGLLSDLPWYGVFKSKDHQAAMEALDTVGLRSFSDCPFGTLSGGQAQRVLIARALVSQPQLLLLDEPTASVDSRAEADIYALLKDLKGHMTIMMVTHDLSAAIDHVERLLCVQGQVFSLQPEEVCEHFVVGLYHTPLIQPKQIRTPFSSPI
ncbi:ABC-type transporter, ATPase subunit [Candidatus Protochlamydia naegleriophila]|uniref:ABC-type transporter, ATPase subunit n=1 Tax=Candidatus Protochlamydia naegleriophila TaxID=389348 RepID=A0A0U5JE11_9BACT|nr:metal ABC transporter ATP-binding protein [Candidatus Protochlamydia naegleriophila]CUI17758.1 ABC-type transporter, ATPase subunit [Candidatus Protochlamydia naegleriophila]